MKSWRQKRNYLCKLIKQVSDENGGDDVNWLREYARDMINKYADNLDVVVACFESLIRKEARCVPESQGSICVPLQHSMEHNLI
jgi:hypothetical protein